MSKNAEGWVRHRGGKCPVEDGQLVDIRLRNGNVSKRREPESLIWGGRVKCDSDIMAFRLHKPAEQVEPDIYAADDSEQSGGVDISFSEPVIVDGPIQWRDRITELDEERKSIDALYQVNTSRIDTERADLVQKLAGEGFALIGRVVEPVEDMSDWRNWKEGDRIEVISKGFDGRNIGEMLTVDGLDDDDSDQPVGVMGDDKTHSWPIVSDGHFLCIKFHSRPSA